MTDRFEFEAWPDNRSTDRPGDLAHRLDEVIPPGDPRLPINGDPDPRVEAARRLAYGPHPELDDSTAAQIEARIRAAVRLAHGPHPALDDRAIAQIETRVLRHAGTQQRRARRTAAKTSRIGRRVAFAVARIAALLAVVFVALFGAAQASAASLPGDTLYPVKRFVERGQLALASEDHAMELRLTFAERRLDEFEHLLARGDLRVDTLDDAVAELESALVLAQAQHGLPDPVAARMLALSARHGALADRAGVQVLNDEARLAELVHSVTEMDALSRRTQELARASEPVLPQGLAAPRTRNRLATPQDTSLYVPQDLPELRPGTTTPDNGSSGSTDVYITP